MARDAKYKKLINCSQWRKLRNMMLAAHPLCKDCQAQGRISAATEVHHIIPVEKGRTPGEMQRLAYSVHNLVSLCHHCHIKRHKELLKGSKESNADRMKEDAEAFALHYYRKRNQGG